MALSNAERQRRFRERRMIEAASSKARQDVFRVYELLRREWLLDDDDSSRGPAEREYREQLAAAPVDMRPAGERPEVIAGAFMGAVASILDRAYRSKIQAKRRIDRKRFAGRDDGASREG